MNQPKRRPNAPSSRWKITNDFSFLGFFSFFLAFSKCSPSVHFSYAFLHKSTAAQPPLRRGNSEKMILHSAPLLPVVELPATLSRPTQSLFCSNTFMIRRFNDDGRCCKRIICKEAQLVAPEYFMQSCLPRSRRWCPVSTRRSSPEHQTRGKCKMSGRCWNLSLKVARRTARCGLRAELLRKQERQ